MDDIVVLILTLIIVVLGAVGQLKKKKPAQPNESQNHNTDNFWDLLQGEPEIASRQTEFVSPEDPVPTPIKPEKVEYKFQPSTEGGSIIATEKEVFNNPEEESEKKKEKVLDENFSLRKAIIYSEIINRKYI